MKIIYQSRLNNCRTVPLTVSHTTVSTESYYRLSNLLSHYSISQLCGVYFSQLQCQPFVKLQSYFSTDVKANYQSRLYNSRTVPLTVFQNITMYLTCLEYTSANYNVSHLCSSNLTLALTWMSFINQDNKYLQDSATDSIPKLMSLQNLITLPKLSSHYSISQMCGVYFSQQQCQPFV